MGILISMMKLTSHVCMYKGKKKRTLTMRSSNLFTQQVSKYSCLSNYVHFLPLEHWSLVPLILKF